MGPPRPGAELKPADLQAPGATVALLVLTTGVNGAVAALKWSNPEAAGGRPKKAAPLRPQDMELLALEQLPLLPNKCAGAAGGAGRGRVAEAVQ